MILIPCAARAADQTALFAGGNFWALQAMFDSLPGVERTVAGYTGGTEANPHYADVAHGRTGHRFVVLVIFNDAAVSYEQLLHAYWRAIDPTDSRGQFCDHGAQYTSAIYTYGAAQAQAAADARMLMETDNTAFSDANGNDIHVATAILPAGIFYPAEIGQQRYYEKNPLRYWLYNKLCRRAARLQSIWGKPSP
ncbi:MAG: peptide-methionine (S)-S-oxide reductase MsrA [Rhodospirillales bacterium]|nr:peptide-methionine (S)-S-oxide reductase MsrA [Alphaproteobacteria bacterium]MCB9986632.1 peptide-methionine (S)-S-oxide reductase MsrA [Rhodospirillales bacterium]USO06839.1 MAG: peptide-methionine (S)-S-oxide reductase MsrA [Rhodospirillales bacterium]